MNDRQFQVLLDDILDQAQDVIQEIAEWNGLDCAKDKAFAEKVQRYHISGKYLDTVYYGTMTERQFVRHVMEVMKRKLEVKIEGDNVIVKRVMENGDYYLAIFRPLRTHKSPVTPAAIYQYMKDMEGNT